MEKMSSGMQKRVLCKQLVKMQSYSFFSTLSWKNTKTDIFKM